MQRKIEIVYQMLDSVNQLQESDQALYKAATEVMKDAYAPYSKFHVGAALRFENGNILKGSNQENIAYPSGLCAERTVLFYAGANYPNEKIETLCITAKGDLVDFDALLSPCGSCRQVMAESENRQQKDYRVILVCQNGKVMIFNSASDLLPLTFGK